MLLVSSATIDRESYGEDIADTENERSDFSDEDDLDDKEASDDIKPEGKKSKHGRLRKKYCSVASDDDGDGGFEEKIIVNDSMDDQTKEFDNEDSLLISSVYKSKARQRILVDEINTSNSGAFDARNKNYEDDGDGNIQTDLETDNVLQDSQRDREATVSDKEKDVEDVKKSKKKKKEKQKETKNDDNDGDSIIQTALKTNNVLQDSQTHREAALSDKKKDVGDVKKSKKKKKEKEIKSSPNGRSIKLDKGEQDKPKIEITLDIIAGQEQMKDGADDDKQTETVDKNLPSSEVGHVQDEKPKKKRKEQQKEHIKQPTDNEDVETIEDAGKAKTKKRKKEQGNKDSHLGEGSVEDRAHDFSNGNQNEEKVKKGKSKSKSKSKGNIEAKEE
ncbi:hypothetical protein Ahy_B04g068950 isoform C [Arachis hypogaea]|uniref:Uncharacterized protein n=1 Tax=Arachis hypogaea TaxID=3818 RepID=A0A444ZB57_ARAHY|nr:hypothetical protein Ahy_B04g068950 isoform C [Arachis hypogaea]